MYVPFLKYPCDINWQEKHCLAVCNISFANKHVYVEASVVTCIAVEIVGSYIYIHIYIRTYVCMYVCMYVSYNS